MFTLLIYACLHFVFPFIHLSHVLKVRLSWSAPLVCSHVSIFFLLVFSCFVDRNLLVRIAHNHSPIRIFGHEIVVTILNFQKSTFCVQGMQLTILSFL